MFKIRVFSVSSDIGIDTGELVDADSYERECNRAQRSAVKRVQERDSAAALPMILCVTRVELLPAHIDEDGAKVDDQYVIELTDGWYRIRSRADAALSRALAQGRLQRGYKVAINGARVSASWMT
jgi:breast cancer 2 susceptibility protein